MNKTILITGGAGFIAHHVIDKILATTDWNIVTLDRLDFSGNLNRLNEVVMSHNSNQRSRVRVIHHDLKSEINPEIANTIGEMVMEGLSVLDQVAFVRFASVYRDFREAKDFEEFLGDMPVVEGLEE